MEPNQIPENFKDENLNTNNELKIEPSLENKGIINPQCGCSKEGSSTNGSGEGKGGCSGSSTPPSYIYAIGKIEPRMPSISVANEIAQVGQLQDNTGLSEDHVLYNILKANRYLVRELCWVLTIEGIETYLIYPRDPVDYDMILEAIRPPEPNDKEQKFKEKFNLVVGVKGPIASAEMCNGLMVPIVVFDKVYTFGIETLLLSVASPDDLDSAEEIFDRIRKSLDNTGSQDEHRALNYLSVRNPKIYASIIEEHKQNYSLTGIETRMSRISGTRRIVEVIFYYTHRNTDVSKKFFCRVDVTEKYPYMITGLMEFYEYDRNFC